MYDPSSTAYGAFVFDRPQPSRQHVSRWGSRAHSLSTRSSHKRETVPSVFIFNILQFPRRKSLNFDELYVKHAPMVARRVRRFVPESDVEEVVHEVFLKAFERQTSYRGDASPTTWLYHIATNHCINRIRDRRRRRQALEINRELPWLMPSAEADSEDLVLLSQLWSSLTEEQSTIAVYYFTDGLTHGEIARIMDVSRRTIGNRIDEMTTMMRSRGGSR